MAKEPIYDEEEGCSSRDGDSIEVKPGEIPLEKQIPKFMRPTPERRQHRLLWVTGGAAILFVVLVTVQWLFNPVEHIRLPKFLFETPKVAPCSQISSDEMDRIKNMTEFSSHIYAAGSPVLASSSIAPDTPICILIAVPQTALPEYKFAPVPGKGPDALHLLVNSSTVTLTFDPPRPVPHQAGLDQQFYDGTMLYMAETTLFDAGTYDINVDQDWANWAWAHEWRNDLVRNVTVYSSGMEIDFPKGSDWSARVTQMRERYPMRRKSVAKVHKFPPHIKVSTTSLMRSSSNSILSRPICSPNISVDSGRWYSNKAFSNQIPVDAFDEWGYAWVGDECRLDYYNENDLFNCLKHRKMHTYGDSNLRRLLLALMTAGGFCRDVHSVCQGNDQAIEQSLVVAEDFNNDNSPFKLITGISKYGVSIDRGANINFFGRGSSAMQSFTETMAMNWEDWVRRFYDPSDIKILIDDEESRKLARDEIRRFNGPAFNKDDVIRPGAKARPPPEAGKGTADIVILSFGTWDEAFTPTFEEVEQTLPHFRDALLEAYPPPTKIWMRMTNGISCMKTYDNYRRYSGPRIQQMHDITRRAFRIGMDGDAPHTGMGGRIVVFDPQSMNGRCEAVRDFGEEYSNHQRFSQVRTEAQTFLNTVCQKDPVTRVARWRD